MLLNECVIFIGGYPILEGKDDASSVASDDSFVVVIPDCFDPGVPLQDQPPATNISDPPPTAEQQPATEQQQQLQSNVQEPSINLICFEESIALPTQPACPLQGNSEPRSQETKPVTVVKQTSKDSPQRPPPLTPYQIFSNPRTHILGRNPWQVGAALIDSTMHHLDKRFGQTSGMYANRPSAPQKMVNVQKTEASKNDVPAANDTDDEFQVTYTVCVFALDKITAHFDVFIGLHF